MSDVEKAVPVTLEDLQALRVTAPAVIVLRPRKRIDPNEAAALMRSIEQAALPDGITVLLVQDATEVMAVEAEQP